jgi:hypothetical protein
MAALATNTFATVRIKKNAQFDFESLVTEFQQALDDGLSGPIRMRRIGGEFVSFDMGRAQLSLAYSSASVDRDGRPAQQARLAVTVGAGETSGKCMTFEERVRFCNGVLDRIEAAYACDNRVWGETDRAILPLNEATPPVQPGYSALGPKRVRKLAAARRRSRPDMMELGEGGGEGSSAATTGPVEPIRLTHPALYAHRIREARVKSPMQTRPLPRQVALGLPQTESRDLHILRSVFAADHDEAEPQVTDRTVAHRLAIYTLNTSLVVICLPVGAAMFSYCALGRENLNAVGRAMALTGIGIALAPSSVLASIMPFVG